MAPLLGLFQHHPLAALVLAAIYGLIVGSFVNVLIARLPGIIHQSTRSQAEAVLANVTAHTEVLGLAHPPSRCPHCAHTIRWWHNVPVLSYIWLRGRCRDCPVPISWGYPAVELTAACLAVLSLGLLGINARGAAVALALCVLLAIAVIDYRHMLIPDGLSIGLLCAGLGVAIVRPYAIASISLEAATTGALMGFVILWFVATAYHRLTGHHGMGGGDPKLASAIGAWVGFTALPVVFVVGCGVCVALTLADRGPGRTVPMGPGLCVGAALVLLVPSLAEPADWLHWALS